MSLLPLQPDAVTVRVIALDTLSREVIAPLEHRDTYRAGFLQYSGRNYVSMMPVTPLTDTGVRWLGLDGWGGLPSEDPEPTPLHLGIYQVGSAIDENLEENFTYLDLMGTSSGTPFYIQVERIQYIATAGSFIQAVIIIAPWGALTAFLWRSLFMPWFYFGQIALLSRRRRLEE